MKKGLAFALFCALFVVAATSQSLHRQIQVTLKKEFRLSAGDLKLGRWTRTRNGATLTLSDGVGTARALKAIRSNPSIRSARLQPPRLADNVLEREDVVGVRSTLERYKTEYGLYSVIEKAPLPLIEGRREAPGTDYLEAWLFDMEQRAYPNRKVNWEAYAEAERHRDAMPPATLGPTDAPSGTWLPMGPTNLDVPYRTYWGLRPVSGRINGIAYDPVDQNVYYIASAGGGAWKTTDAGVTWTPLSDGWSRMLTTCVAVDPTNRNIVYVGTGDFWGSRSPSIGLMKSTNGGASFIKVGGTVFDSNLISDILIDPENPSIITVSSGRGSAGTNELFRSVDGGLTFNIVINQNVSWCDLTMGPNVAGIRNYYVSGGGTGGNLWKSVDRGATWTKLTPPINAGSHSRLHVSASPINANNAYLISAADNNIYRSLNGGTTWTAVGGGLPSGTSWGQDTYDIHINCSSKTGGIDVVYVGLIDIVQSPDGGTTWQSVGGPTPTGNALTHNDQHALTVNPTNPNEVLLSNDGGIYRLTYNPAANTWVYGYLSRNICVTTFYNGSYHPTSKNHMLGGTQDNATPTALGDLLNWANKGGGDGAGTTINRINGNIQYTMAQYGSPIYRTGNLWSSSGTLTWSNSGDAVPFIPTLTSDPNVANLMYIGSNYLYRYNDSPAAWTNRLGGVALSATGTIRAIRVAPGDSNRIYTGASDGQLWMTSNQGTTWTQINTGSPSLPVRSITSMSVHTTNKNDLLVSLSGTGTAHLWRCADVTAATRVWTSISGAGATGLPDIPHNSVCRDLDLPTTTLYVGTDVGAFMSTDAGTTWSNATAPLGLPNVQVNTVETVAGTRFLNCATYGRGMWRIALPASLVPTSFTLTGGTLASGNLGSLAVSDDNRLAIQGDEFNPSPAAEFQTASPIASLSRLEITSETSSSRTDMGETLQLFNYTLAFGAGAWDPGASWTRTPTLGDSTITQTIIVNPSQFVHQTTRALRARLIWVPLAETIEYDGWGTRTDLLRWMVTP